MSEKKFGRPFVHPPSPKFWDEFNKLCSEAPTKKETCQRIRDNQEHYLEFQQKCLSSYDPDIQQAIEHAGDIIRELSQRGCEGWSLSYIAEKHRRLGNIIEDLNARRALSRD